MYTSVSLDIAFLIIRGVEFGLSQASGGIPFILFETKLIYCKPSRVKQKKRRKMFSKVKYALRYPLSNVLYIQVNYTKNKVDNIDNDSKYNIYIFL